MKVTPKLLLLLAFFHFLNIVGYIRSVEDTESFRKRVKFYQKVKLLSNYSIVLGYDREKELSCIANDFLEPGHLIFKIPKKYTLCPYYIFPFKNELFDLLLNIPGMKDHLETDQKISVYLLSYLVLYHAAAPKADVMKYIHEKKLVQYYNITEIDDELFSSFPKIISNAGFFEEEHLDLLAQFGYTNKMSELENIWKYISRMVLQSEHAEAIFPWISNFNDFRWAYSIVTSRGLTLNLNEYYRLDNVKEAEKDYTQWEKQNLEINRIIGKFSGVPCIIAFADLCNHYQPRFSDLRDKHQIILESEKDYLIDRLSSYNYPDQEVSYTYINDPAYSALLFNYGFVIRNNIFNLAQVKLEDDKVLSKSQFKLCQEVNCFESHVREPSQVPKARYVSMRINEIEDSLLNYGRVKYLKPDFDYAQIRKALMNEQPISFINEVSAWLFYFQTIYQSVNNRLSENKNKGIKHLIKIQTSRNKQRELEKNWTNDENQINEWLKQKSFENIHSAGVSLQLIADYQMAYSLNYVISNTIKELDKVKGKYLS